MKQVNILYKLFPGAYGMLVYATVRLLQDSASGFRFWNRPVWLNLLEVTISIGVGYLSTALIKWVCTRHDRQPASTTKSTGLLIREIGGVVVISILIVNIFLTPMAALTDDGLSGSDFAYINTIPLLYMLIYYGWLRSSYFLKAYVQQQVLVEKMTNDRLETELKFLKAQYHPHFLFNALNTVYFQMDENVACAKESIEKLSELLRYQLYDQQEKVGLGKEIQYLYNFIDLQKVRSADQLKVNILVEDKIASIMVYPLLFLPLVENAFKYVGGKYQIDIKLFLKEGSIHFIVINSLPGIQLKKTNSGIGLENLKRRLELLYPRKHQLLINKDHENYTAQIILDFV